MKIREFGSVWDAIESDPIEAANMKMRSQLLVAVQQTLADWNVSDAEAVKRLEITDEQLSSLRKGHIGEFSLDQLTELASRAGISVRLDVERPAA